MAPNPDHNREKKKEHQPPPGFPLSSWVFDIPSTVIEVPTTTNTIAASTSGPQSVLTAPASATPARGYSPNEVDYKSDHPSKTKFIPPAIGAVVAVAIIILIGASLCILRHRRRRPQTRSHSSPLASSPAMSQRAFFAPQLPPYAPPPPAHVSPSPTGSFSSPIPAAAMSSSTASLPGNRQQPVILSTTVNTYFTGLDTADHISLADRRSSTASVSRSGAVSSATNPHLEPIGDPELDDEPPPPYRPRSVPPISRETSVVVRERPVSRVSPFEDPENEVSDVEDGGDEVGEDDRRSIVSELEIGGEPVRGRESV